jgi:hypothetical protein
MVCDLLYQIIAGDGLFAWEKACLAMKITLQVP